jgi:hypothetical protein
LKAKVAGAEVTIEVGPSRSEFAVFVDEVVVFSRMEQRRYPEAEELVAICTRIAQQ